MLSALGSQKLRNIYYVPTQSGWKLDGLRLEIALEQIGLQNRNVLESLTPWIDRQARRSPKESSGPQVKGSRAEGRDGTPRSFRKWEVPHDQYKHAAGRIASESFSQ